MDNIILENSLYADATSRAALVADKKLCMDALLINYFGFLGLFKINDSRGIIKKYETTEGKLFLSNIGDTNHDVSLSIKLAVEAGCLLQPAAMEMTKLLVLIKNKTIKGVDLQEQNVKDLLKATMYHSHQPDAKILSIADQFMAGTISLPLFAKELYIASKAKHLQPITVEFRNIVMKGQYQELFAKILPGAVAPATPTPPAAQTNVVQTTAAVMPTPAHGTPSPVMLSLPRYTNTTPGHNKYWAGEVVGDTLFYVYGPLSSPVGALKDKKYPSNTLANYALATILRTKIANGYVLNGKIDKNIASAQAVTGPIPMDGDGDGAPAVSQNVKTVKPAPIAAAPVAPVVPKGPTPEFYSAILDTCHDLNGMNDCFKKYGVAKSTLDLVKFHDWALTHIDKHQNFKCKSGDERFNDLPLIKHLKTLSRYSTIVDFLMVNWVANSLTYGVDHRDGDYLMNKVNWDHILDDIAQKAPRKNGMRFRQTTNTVGTVLKEHFKKIALTETNPQTIINSVVKLSKILNIASSLFGTMYAWKENNLDYSQLVYWSIANDSINCLIADDVGVRSNVMTIPNALALLADAADSSSQAKLKIKTTLKLKPAIKGRVATVVLPDSLIHLFSTPIKNALKFLSDNNLGIRVLTQSDADKLEREEIIQHLIRAADQMQVTDVVKPFIAKTSYKDLKELLINNDDWVKSIKADSGYYFYKMTSTAMRASPEYVKFSDVIFDTILKIGPDNNAKSRVISVILEAYAADISGKKAEYKKYIDDLMMNQVFVEKYLENDNDMGLTNSLVKYLEKEYPTWINSHPKSLFVYAHATSAIQGQVEFSSAKEYHDSVALACNFYRGIFGFSESTNAVRLSRMVTYATATKNSFKKYVAEILAGNDWNSSTLNALAIIAAINGPDFCDLFLSGVTVEGCNRMMDTPNGIMVASQYNKPFVKAIFDRSATSGVTGAVSTYISCLDQAELNAKIQDGTLKTMVDRGVKDDKLMRAMKNIITENKTDPALAVKSIGLLEHLFTFKQSYDKSSRDDAIDDIIDHLSELNTSNKSMSDVIFKEMKGDIKRSIIDRVTGDTFMNTIKPTLLDKSALIRPLTDVDESRIHEMLKFNKVSIPTIRVNSPAAQDIDTLKKAAEQHALAIAHPKVSRTQPVTKQNMTREEYLLRKSVEYDKFNKYKHGNLAVKFLDEFEVNIPEQRQLFDNFLAKKPNTTKMHPVFHGTGSIAASMILRFGFTIIASKDPSVTGRMLGDGIYFSDVLDKVAQYMGDKGFGRKIGTRGYIFQMSALLGDDGIDYKSANYTVSPEWCVRTTGQVRIEKAFLAELITKDDMLELKKKYPITESAAMPIITFSEFLRESATEGLDHSTTYIFLDGMIPTSHTTRVDFEELDVSLFPDNVRMEPSAYGPMIIIDHNTGESESFYVDNTHKFMNDADALGKFFDLFNYMSSGNSPAVPEVGPTSDSV